MPMREAKKKMRPVSHGQPADKPWKDQPWMAWEHIVRLWTEARNNWNMGTQKGTDRSASEWSRVWIWLLRWHKNSNDIPFLRFWYPSYWVSLAGLEVKTYPENTLDRWIILNDTKPMKTLGGFQQVPALISCHITAERTAHASHQWPTLDAPDGPGPRSCNIGTINKLVFLDRADHKKRCCS